MELTNEQKANLRAKSLELVLKHSHELHSDNMTQAAELFYGFMTNCVPLHDLYLGALVRYKNAPKMGEVVVISIDRNMITVGWQNDYGYWDKQVNAFRLELVPEAIDKK